MTGRTRRAAAYGTGMLLAGATLTGCGLELDDVPLPDLVSGPTYSLTLEFEDALNLPVDAPVKLEGATVGQVVDVAPGDYVAEVEVMVSTRVELRSSTTAEIRLTSPMGTAFVELFPGRRGAVIAAGDVLDADRTSEAPDVTDLLGALSTVVTGGSFGDISTIIDQLNVALTGNAPTVRRLIGRLDGAVTDLNRRLPTLDRLTVSLDRLTTRLVADLPELTDAMTDLTGLVQTLDRQREDLLETLDSLNRFEAVATPLSAAVSADLTDQLGSLETVLGSLLATRSDIDGVMAGLAAFTEGTEAATPGDYANFDLTFLLDPDALAAMAHGDDPELRP